MTIDASFLGAVAARTLSVYPAGGLRVVEGANRDDALSVADDLVAGDVYRLSPRVEPGALSLTSLPGSNRLRIARGSLSGRIGAEVLIDCSATLMASDGTTAETLLLVELARGGGTIADLWLYPLAEIAPRTDYTLVAIDRAAGRGLFADSACVCFARGTRIALADGVQAAIEDLEVGTRVLTRDRGAQPIRWIGRQTVRALGAFAPVRIRAGALGNTGDLVVGPDHPIFVPPPPRPVAAPAEEAPVAAQSLLDGIRVQQIRGGFVDYFGILFDRPEIVFAEGCAAAAEPFASAQRPGTMAGARAVGTDPAAEARPAARTHAAPAAAG